MEVFDDYDVLHLVLPFLSIVDAMQVGMTSKRLSGVVNTDALLWMNISFPPLYAPALNDKMLAALLSRVDAKTRTQSLSLRGCSLVTGSGLKPLWGSTSLVVLDLRLGLDDHTTLGPIITLDHVVLLSLVTSIFSAGTATRVAGGLPTIQDNATKPRLEVIKLRRQRTNTSRMEWRSSSLDSWDQPWRGIIERLRNHLLLQKQEQNIRCGTCNRRRIEVDTVGDEVMKLPACSMCREHTCEKGPSCPLITTCSLCGDTHCYDCNFGSHCDICNDSFCDSCRYACPCEECGLTFCGDCRFAAFCDKCDTPFCDDCKMVMLCNDCELPFCGECKNLDLCNDCELPFCEDCKNVNFCSNCEVPFCEDCKFVDFCNKCTAPFCEDCNQMMICDDCELPFCADCKQVIFCGDCNLPFCVDCKEVSSCNNCNSLICADCKIDSLCDECKMVRTS